MEECLSPEDASENNDQMLSQNGLYVLNLTAETMLDKNITTDDVHFAISNSQYGNEISCVFSDYNNDKLVFRIRVNSSIFSK